MVVQDYHGTVLYAHDCGSFFGPPPGPPIGENLSFQRILLPGDVQATVARARFAGLAQNNSLAETVYLMGRDGFPLNASIGFEPLEWVETKEGVVVFTLWNLVEWSVVPIGANLDSQKLAAFSAEHGRAILDPLREWCERGLAAFSGEGRWIVRQTIERTARLLSSAQRGNVGMDAQVFDFFAVPRAAAAMPPPEDDGEHPEDDDDEEEKIKPDDKLPKKPSRSTVLDEWHGLLVDPAAELAREAEPLILEILDRKLNDRLAALRAPAA